MITHGIFTISRSNCRSADYVNSDSAYQDMGDLTGPILLKLCDCIRCRIHCSEVESRKR